MDANMSLLDAMAVQAGCEFLSDLRYIDDLQRLRLARALEKVSPQSGTLFEWNDALEYLNNLIIRMYEAKDIDGNTDLSRLTPGDYPIFDD